MKNRDQLTLPLFQIDSFTTRQFRGNPACVMELSEWLDDPLLQHIAAENAVAATAFFTRTPDEQRFQLRWFTPTVEIPLCAHGTLAAALVICNRLKYANERLTFETRAGDLTCQRTGKAAFSMDFPVDEYEQTELDRTVIAALGAPPTAMLRARYSVAVFDHEHEVTSLTPNVSAIAQCHHAKNRGAVVATAPAAPDARYDFVSRFFAPGVGVDEDPVTGSAHCILAAYWSDRLDKAETLGYQASSRGGYVHCSLARPRVELSGHATLYSQGVAMIRPSP